MVKPSYLEGFFETSENYTRYGSNIREATVQLFCLGFK